MKGSSMLHVITLFTVSDHEDAFVRSLRMNCDWLTLARRIAPDLIATDLLRHQLSPLHLCHDFWTTPAAYIPGLHSPTVESLFLARRQMASACFELGVFQFPALTNSVASTAAASIK
jgi:hypothetical protein